MATELGFCVLNLGCKVNRVESDVMTAQMMALGASPAAFQDAQVVLINTCAVTAEAERKTRKEINKACRLEGRPHVIVTGCSAALHARELEALGDRVVVMPDRMRAPAVAARLIGIRDAASFPQGDLRSAACDPGQGGLGQAADDALQGATIAPRLPAPDAQFDHSAVNDIRFGQAGGLLNTRMGIKVQDGCDNACSFCVVHVARGRSRSKDADDVLREAQAASDAGVRELVLTGINLGAYSTVRNGSRLRLPELLELILGATRDCRIRLSSIEPPDVTERLVAAMGAGGSRVCRHLHVPLQSGCDVTLGEMGRHYSTAEYANAMRMLREGLSGVAITTDVICGFPGETSGDFEQSLAFCEGMRFSKMHVFRYSRRGGTLAAAYPRQIAPDVSAERSREMRALASRMRLEDARGRVGTSEFVLVERDGLGTSDSYHRVVVEGDCGAGELARVRFESCCDDGTLAGRVVDAMEH